MGTLRRTSIPLASRQGGASGTFSQGFTLVEMLVTVAISAILLAAAVPAMTQFVADQAAGSNADEFVESLRFARTEAMKRGSAVEVCPSSDQATCSADWMAGWIVKPSVGGRVLRVQNNIRKMEPIETDNGTTLVIFQSTGIATGGADTYKFIPVGSDRSRCRLVDLNVQGRVNVTRGGC